MRKQREKLKAGEGSSQAVWDVTRKYTSLMEGGMTLKDLVAL
jgi:hypothetical protein